LIRYMKNIMIICLSLLILGCVSKVEFSPDKLPDGYVGKPYYAKVTIIGNAGPADGARANYSINPSDFGLKIHLCDPDSPVRFNCVVISGVPNKSGDIVVSLQGATLTTSYFLSGKTFDKKYVFKIN
ncbi:hypothetical protein, partial [Brenneria goodwinii]